MPISRPHQAVYWQVRLAPAAELRIERRRWCRNNVEHALGKISWIAPASRKATDPWPWDTIDTEEEIWHFARYEDAVMFEMVWQEIS